MGGAVALLQRGTARVIELAATTQELQGQGLLEPGQRLVARIRKVRAAEVVAATGTSPLLFALARSRRPGESKADFVVRMEQELLDDPQLVQDSHKQQLDIETAVVALGVTAVGTGSGDEIEWEDVHLDAHGGEPSVTILGASLGDVYNAIVTLGGLPYQRMGVAGGLEAFPEQPAGTARESGSSVLRTDPDGLPEQADR